MENSSSIINYIIIFAFIGIGIRFLYQKILFYKETKELKSIMDKDILSQHKSNYNEEFTNYYTKIMFSIPIIKQKDITEEEIKNLEKLLSNIFKLNSILNGRIENIKIKKFKESSNEIINNLKELHSIIENKYDIKIKIKELS